MSRNRRRRRYYLDAGDGVTLATTMRGPLDPKTADALKELARAAAVRMRAGELPPARDGARS